MRKPLRLLNLLLGLVAVLITAALAKTWIAPIVPVPNPVAKRSLQEVEAVAYNPAARPPLAQFDILLERNPFKQPPPMPVRPFSAPSSPPLPTLAGTILVDHERRAILSDKGKANIYTTGQEVAGGVITEIKEDRVIFKRGETMHEIMLKAAIAPAAGQPGGQTGQTTTPTPAQVEGSPAAGATAADREDLQRRRQAQREQRRRMLEQRRATQ